MIYSPIELFVVAEQLQVHSPPLTAEVRSQKDYFSKYPQQIRVGNRSAVSYNRQLGYYAVHYNQPGTEAPGSVLQLNDGAIAVFQGEPDEPKTDIVSPIYALQPDGSLAVPTGLVFIRFVVGVDVESQREVLKYAGYEVAQNLSYAPHAAWLRAQSGEILDAILKIPQLEAIPNVENVELQMLMARVQRQ